MTHKKFQQMLLVALFIFGESPWALESSVGMVGSQTAKSSQAATGLLVYTKPSVAPTMYPAYRFYDIADNRTYSSYGINKTTKNYVVVHNNKTNLIEALKNANPGDVIYVGDGAEIDMTGERNILIPSGVTLASNGGLIHADLDIKAAQLFLITGPNVHITGLKFRGPGPYFEGDYDQTRLPDRVVIRNPSLVGARCITARAPVEVDNCEFWYWSYSCILLQDQKDLRSHIHHNYFHDCCGTMGYGIQINDGYPLIDYNVFDRCRHAIAGTGQEGCSYEAAYNEVRSGVCDHYSCFHSFDMHAPGEGIFLLKPFVRAGDWIEIHHNTFSWTKGPAVIIRGIPRVGASIHDNWFYHDAIGGFGTKGAVLQVNAKGHFDVFSNVLTPYKVPAKEIHY